ncbi:unnamed protein product [Didymodactylos carnosus]|uniref:Uncharacterized protein n=1 Tax=Didymodactylos carnosus TaxID=1234261 RepID=A0A815SW56_9BILA|nr:unnamed protein product [Didymodactylos carnosus]CAF4356777.1 unnamed protein product [Didymodactylos carnosus]
MDGISEAYKNSEKWTTRKEILSIVAPKISCKLIQSFSPGLTLYRFTTARRHALEYGRQVKHFILSPHICTDLPFGEQRLRLSTGVELYVPNTIRNIIPSRIVDQYFEYIAENNPGFPPLGPTSLLSLLNSCKASTRHSLQGVNYFAANASLAFDNLIDMVNDLSLDSDSKKILVDDVKRGRMYLKTDYKVHVQKSSTIADHCINYTLSQSNDTGYAEKCDHRHDVYVYIYLNQKHNITNAAEFVEAVHSYEGVKGVQAYECSLIRNPKPTKVTFPKITFVNNFGFEHDGIRVHRAWNVGVGLYRVLFVAPFHRPLTTALILDAAVVSNGIPFKKIQIEVYVKVRNEDIEH